MEDLIEQFVSVRYGDGSGTCYGFGSGSGFGSGDCDCDGDGFGYGSGSGYCYDNGSGSGSCDCDGYGDGSGDGYGNGEGIAKYNGKRVYVIDCIQTIIDSVHGNYAIGRIIHSDLTLADCYIAKCGDYFAHGDTLRKAMDDAKDKYEQKMPLEDRIARFIAQYPSLDTLAENKDLYAWHHVLTGSCEFGRKQFASEYGIDIEQGSMTIREFISLTKDAYGSEAINQLLKSYKQ